VCLTVSANEKPSNLPLYASNPLASLTAAQQGMAQKVIVSESNIFTSQIFLLAYTGHFAV